jgi:hypothetical protein
MNGHHAHPTVADFVVPQVLALSYTAHDLAPFARDLGYVDAQMARCCRPSPGTTKTAAPAWPRSTRCSSTSTAWMPDDAAYILDTFPIVREQDIEAAFGRYRTKDDVLNHLMLLQGGAT